jgi:hypothetical protein
MTVGLQSYRAAIGTWHLSCLCRSTKPPKGPLTPIKIKLLLHILLNSYGILICSLLLLRCGDVHPKPGPTFENKSITISHANVQSLYLKSENYKRRKIDEIEKVLINDLHHDIICLSETWLNDQIEDALVDIKGYKIHRKDRSDHRACGAGMYITHAIPNRRAYELEFPNTDLLWVELHLSHKKILVGACYRPPGQSQDEVALFMSDLEDSLELAFRQKPESIFLLGDINDTCTVWDSEHTNSELGLKLYDYINSHDLHQLILSPTHVTSHSATILDLLITDSPGYVTNQGIFKHTPIGSNHQIICCVLKLQYQRDKIYSREIWSYDKGDYPALRQTLSNIPWDTENAQQAIDIDNLALSWHSKFMDTCKAFIPNRQIKIRPMDKPWFNHESKIAIRNRNRYYKRFLRTRTQLHHDDWKHASKLANYVMSKAKQSHQDKINKMLMDIRPGAKKYWKLAKQVYGSKKIMGIPSLIVDNIPITTSSAKAEKFNIYFADQQTEPIVPFNHSLPPIHFLTLNRLNSIETNPLEVAKILKCLDIGKANGPDGVSNRLLRETYNEIALPLTNLFNKSFTLGKVPMAWKESNICPIFKKDDKSKVSNYRPIALLSNTAKAQERVVYIHLYKYLKNNNLLTWKNSGFKALDSAVNQLLFITDKIHKALEEGREICLVFLDISKAFDKVWHPGLLHKLRCMGIEGPLFDWFCDYLLDRKIRVVINGQNSDWRSTTAGVPQGSILGPLLFLVFINDITANIESDIHLFADDTSLMDIIDNYALTYAKLNRDLHRLSLWSKRWLVTFNPSKTVYLQISRKLFPSPKPILRLNGQIINEVKTHKHLGLTFNTTLTWTDHIGNLVSKSSQCIGLLRRISRDVPRQCLEILYKAMIRPLLEYADVVFDGCSDTNAQRLESTQRQAALTCTGAYKHTSHTKLLQELGWTDLALRRKHHRLGIMYKIQTQIAPPYLRSVCPPLTRDRTSYNLRTSDNITTPHQRTSTYQQSFYPHTIKDWNNLDRNTRNSTSITNFKDKLKKSTGAVTNKLFHHNSARAAINHTRMRLGLSALSSQRHDYKHIDKPTCKTCGAKSEDPTHYFLLCPTYSAHRPTLLQETCNILFTYDIQVDFTSRAFRKFYITTLLQGTQTITMDDNKKIFNFVQTYIQQSQRFP